jgi:hypothetical protein
MRNHSRLRLVAIPQLRVVPDHLDDALLAACTLDALWLVVLVDDIPAISFSDAEAVWARNGIDFTEPPFRLINDGGDAVSNQLYCIQRLRLSLAFDVVDELDVIHHGDLAPLCVAVSQFRQALLESNRDITLPRDALLRHSREVRPDRTLPHVDRACSRFSHGFFAISSRDFLCCLGFIQRGSILKNLGTEAEFAR